MLVNNLKRNTYRLLFNGDIAFLNRRFIPQDGVDGYIQSDTNPMKFHPQLEPCDYRVENAVKIACCKEPIIRYYCNKLDKKITLKQCKEGGITCQERSSTV